MGLRGLGAPTSRWHDYSVALWGCPKAATKCACPWDKMRFLLEQEVVSPGTSLSLPWGEESSLQGQRMLSAGERHALRCDKQGSLP